MLAGEKKAREELAEATKREKTMKKTPKYKIDGDRLPAANVQLIQNYVSTFHVGYSWRYIWRAYLKKCKGLEAFKRAVAPHWRKTIVMLFRYFAKKQTREYIKIMGHLPIPNQKMVAEVMLGHATKEEIGL